MKRAILVDTSAFHALQNAGNLREHKLACRIAERLESENIVLITTDYVLDETYTLLRSVLGHKGAVSFGREIQRGGIEIVEIDRSLRQAAWNIFEQYADKDFSFTDCTSFAVMRRGKIETAFTFDRHFQQYGFNTVPERLAARRI